MDAGLVFSHFVQIPQSARWPWPFGINVVCVLAGANSAYSASPSPPTTINLATPAAPTLGIITNTTVQLNWVDIAGETSYDIVKDEVPMGLVIPKNTLTYTVTGLTPNTTYTFRVKAVNSYNTATSPAALPAKTTVNPTTLTSVTPLSSSELKLLWVDVSGEAGYEIQSVPLVNHEENPASPPSGWGTWTIRKRKRASAKPCGPRAITRPTRPESKRITAP